MTHAQARVSAVWGVGSAESEKTISPVQAVIDNEIIGMVKRFLPDSGSAMRRSPSTRSERSGSAGNSSVPSIR